MTLPRDLRWFVLPVLATPLLATAILSQPFLVVGLSAAAVFTIVGLVYPGTLTRAFSAMLAFILVGYAFFGRAFAYLGVPPLYVGEITLAIGLLCLFIDYRLRLPLRSLVLWLWVAFALWCAARTLPYLTTYGLDALRDAATWGYGVFAVLVAATFAGSNTSDAVMHRYAKWVPRFILWVPVGMLLSYFAYDLFPIPPGGSKPLLPVRAGDAGTHLAGVAAFLLLGLGRLPSRTSRPGPLSSGQILWPLWACAFAFAAAVNRGGMLAVMLAILTVVVLRPLQALRKLYLIAAIMVTLGLVAYSLDFTVNFGTRRGRIVSVDQIVENVTSIGGSSNKELQGTKEWRLTWWKKIVDYTIYGEHFWSGRGFGVSLGQEDGFATGNNLSLRSPHNAHLTILARAGVPGLILWALLQVGFGWEMVKGYTRALRVGADRAARLMVWTLAFWIAHLVDMTFTVTLEGPQGGIWFWCIMGFGVALLETQRSQRSQPLPQELGRRAA